MCTISCTKESMKIGQNTFGGGEIPVLLVLNHILCIYDTVPRFIVMGYNFM
jgi:hypothetical protein